MQHTAPPRVRDIFFSFLKMGAVLIGGGYALMPLLEREIVAKRAWAKTEDMLDLYALAQLLPGVIAVNTAMLVGNRLRGFKGTVAAAAGLTLVPFLMIAAYAALYGTLQGSSIFSRALGGVQAAVAGMILGLGVDMARKVCKGDSSGISFSFVTLAALAMLLVNPSFVWLIAASALIGLLWHFIVPGRAAR